MLEEAGGVFRLRDKYASEKAISEITVRSGFSLVLGRVCSWPAVVLT